MRATPARVLYSHPHYEASTRMVAIEPPKPLHTMSESVRGSLDPQNPFASHHLPVLSAVNINGLHLMLFKLIWRQQILIRRT